MKTKLHNLLLTAVALISIGTAGSCLAQTAQKGEIYAPTPCHLAPSSPDIFCAAVVVPLKTTFTLRRVIGKIATTTTVRSDEDGHFKVNLPRGRYRVKLLAASSESFETSDVLDPSVLRVFPGYVTIARNGSFVRLIVVHKDYSDAPIK
jgi:hypothetical protein